MFHYFNNLVNASNGNALPGYLVYVLDASGTIIPIYSDESGTPIQTVSDYENAAITDDEGNYDLYVEDGTYSLQFRTTTGSILDTIINVPMISNVALTDLSADDGATLVGTSSGDTVQVVLDEKVATVDLTAPTGSGLAGFLASGTDADPRTVQDKLREIRTVTDFGADPTNVADSRAAFLAAATAAGTGGTVIIPQGTYFVSDVVDILDGQTWRFEGATLRHTDDTKTFLRADGKSDWSIEGNVILQGLLTTAETTAECGLHITNGKRFRVEGVTAKLFKGKGIWLDGVDSGTYRGDRGQFTDCATHECTVGLQVDAGAGAEYNTWVNFCASGNTTAVVIGAGNNTFVGGNVVDNTTGIKLVNGANHGHGMFVGTNINHNNAENIHAIAVINGYTFAGCHIYGNGTTTGAIWLDGCRGITIEGGVIDCYIYNDSGTGSGANNVTGNYFPGDYGVQLLSNNGALGQLFVSGNFGPNWPSEINDPAAVFVEATRASTAQDLSAGSTTLVFNNEIKDLRAAYDPATGIFTAPFPCTVRDEVTFTVTAASGLAASYVALVKGASSDVGYAPMTALSATLGVGGLACTVTLNTGETLRWKSTITGTSPVLAITQSRRTITLVQ